MNEHAEQTPGPWTVHSEYIHRYSVAGERLSLCVGYIIDEVPKPEVGQFENEADALLAAAAPDLLAVCEALLTIVYVYALDENVPSTDRRWADVEKAEAAIAKARGAS